MAEPPKIPAINAEQIRSLALETGVSEKDIRVIIQLVGLDRASIIREARILKKTR
ncbi:MAG: hypothetical protein WBA88_26205 [Pseudaminobacter sp.]